MGVVIAVCAAALAYLIGFCCGYEECFHNEILPAYEKYGKAGDEE